MPFPVTVKKLEMIILSELSETRKDRYHRISFLWNLKMDTNELFTKENQPQRLKKETYGYQRRKFQGAESH